MLIRPAANRDTKAIWAIMERASFGGARPTPFHATRAKRARAYWLSMEREGFLAEDNGDIVGTYCLQANRNGGGAQVANCGYMTDVSATGRGVARAMCAHSLDRARARGFRAMQYNFVISTNDRSVRLWQSFGFEIVGHLPGSLQHPTLGYVDAYIMQPSPAQFALMRAAMLHMLHA